VPISGKSLEDARDTYHDIQTTKLLDGLIYSGFDIGFFAHIGLESDSLDVGEAFCDELGSLFRIGDVDVRKDDARPLRRKEERRFQSDAAAIHSPFDFENERLERRTIQPL